jgi:NADH-quinone oxidoreductase subunit C
MTRDVPTHDVETSDWVEAHERLRSEGFTFFDFLTAVDESDRGESGPSDGKPAGFDIVTHLYDIAGGARRSILMRTRLEVDDHGAGAPSIASLTGLWRGAAWHERETFEMFGIDFVGFDDGTGQGVRKLLLPASFTGTPLRKSFVLTARASKEWPGIKDPGESGGRAAPSKRRKVMAPGVPDETWGPR